MLVIAEIMELMTAAVEPMPRPSLVQMLANLPQVSQRMLDQTISDVHLAKIAGELIDWKSVCTYLRIGEAEEAAIEEENRRADARRCVELLLMCHCMVCSSRSIRSYCYTNSECSVLLKYMMD